MTVDSSSRPLRAWLAWFNFLRRWHRLEVAGLHHLNSDRSMLIVGYHGRPIAHDLCMLQNVLYERLGYLPHPIVHAAFSKNKALKKAIDDLGFVTGDGPSLSQVVIRGEHIIVTPGGVREGCRSSLQRHRVDWGNRTGYIRLALKYNLPIVPVATRGTDNAFVGLNDGYRLGKRLGLPHGIPLWVGIGLTGVWPCSLPLPVKMRLRIGPPIQLTEEGPVDSGNREALLRLHRRVTGAVQALLDQR